MKKRALLINDSKFESLILRDMLNKLDYDVELADEFDAVYEVEQFGPDIVIVNYIMQETTGDQLIQRIKSGVPETKCVLSSSMTVKLTDFKGKKIDGILRTPVSIFTLKDLLCRIGEAKVDTEYLLGALASNLSETRRFCSGCNQDITALGEHIVFCPYCGEEIS